MQRSTKWEIHSNEFLHQKKKKKRKISKQSNDPSQGLRKAGQTKAKLVEGQ
jgi:hypothetical protein